jgi:mono/diheme cytochrome c family protein
MKLIATALACIALSLVVIGCNNTLSTTNSPAPVAGAPSQPPDELATARALFKKNCEGCHGPKGEGGPTQVDGKEIKVPSLHDERIAKHTDEKFTKVIKEGDGPMPPFADKLKSEEIAELVKFVRKEFQGK